jgi:hypothetical protein
LVSGLLWPVVCGSSFGVSFFPHLPSFLLGFAAWSFWSFVVAAVAFSVVWSSFCFFGVLWSLVVSAVVVVAGAAAFCVCLVRLSGGRFSSRRFCLFGLGVLVSVAALRRR